MDIASLNQLVALQAPAAMQDDAGQPIAAWADLVQVWADVRYTRGLEAIRAGAVTSVSQVNIRIRRRADVTSGMRVLAQDGTVYAVLAVHPDMKTRQFVDLVCEVVR